MHSPSIIKFINNSCLNELQNAIESLSGEGVKSILLLTCAENEYVQEKLQLILKASVLPICGGIFPKIIYKNKSFTKGAIVLGLMIEPEIVNYNMLATSDTQLRSYIEANSQNIKNQKDFILIIDALSSGSENFIDCFYNYIGSGVTTIGGGAGSLDFQARPVIFTNQGLQSDVTQVIALPTPIKNSIGHGWKILEGPYLVTASNGHYVESLNYTSPFMIYRDIIQNKTDYPLPENFFSEFSKKYPLGLMSLDGEILVRDPIQTDGSYLECVGNVPVNSMVYLLQSDSEKMIVAAKDAAQKIVDKEPPSTLLLFDCISRDLFMEDKISEELEAIQRPFPTVSLVGAMALGEIANTSSGSIRLLNKSIVLGSF